MARLAVWVRFGGPDCQKSFGAEVTACVQHQECGHGVRYRLAADHVIDYTRGRFLRKSGQRLRADPGRECPFVRFSIYRHTLEFGTGIYVVVGGDLARISKL